MTINVKTAFNANALHAQLAAKVHRAQIKLDIQVVNDSNYYCPKLNNILQPSAVKDTVAGSGKVRWTVDYARRQYYGEHFDHSKSRNPNATAKWFESAKARRADDWRKLVDDEIKHR